MFCTCVLVRPLGSGVIEDEVGYPFRLVVVVLGGSRRSESAVRGGPCTWLAYVAKYPKSILI